MQVSYAVADAGSTRPVTGTDVVVLRKDWAGDWAILTHFERKDGGAAPTADSAGSH
jgi:uncharacterized cupin superfamily protein